MAKHEEVIDWITWNHPQATPVELPAHPWVAGEITAVRQTEARLVRELATGAGIRPPGRNLTGFDRERRELAARARTAIEFNERRKADPRATAPVELASRNRHEPETVAPESQVKVLALDQPWLPAYEVASRYRRRGTTMLGIVKVGGSTAGIFAGEPATGKHHSSMQTERVVTLVPFLPSGGGGEPVPAFGRAIVIPAGRQVSLAPMSGIGDGGALGYDDSLNAVLVDTGSRGAVEVWGRGLVPAAMAGAN